MIRLADRITTYIRMQAMSSLFFSSSFLREFSFHVDIPIAYRQR